MFPLLIFATPTEEGTELARRIGEIGLRLGYEAVEVAEPTQSSLNKACFSNQVIVFDATVEKDGRHLYHAATAQPMALDQILVVSRTYLPINFPGLRQGGASSYPGSFTNGQILHWLETQLVELSKTQPRRELGLISYFAAMRKSLRRAAELRRQEGKIFISYRSHSSQEVSLLGRRLAAGEFHSEPKTVRIVPPGALAYENELLTAHRRWMLQVTLEYWISAAEEVWIYDTDDYYRSWWTQGEIVHVLSSTKDPWSKIRVFDPKVGRPRKLERTELPELSKEQKRRLARLEANANPSTMGGEALAAMAAWRQIPLVGELPYFKDRVWSDEFNFWPLNQCENCSSTATAATTRKIDAEVVLHYSYLHKLDPRALYEILRNAKTFPCPNNCGTVFEIEMAPPRFVWYAYRVGKPTGPDGATIVELPCFRASPIGGATDSVH